jgi:hypothetical protein
MHGPTLPVPVFVGLHFVKAGVFADSLVHALFVARSAPSFNVPVGLGYFSLEYRLRGGSGGLAIADRRG